MGIWQQYQRISRLLNYNVKLKVRQVARLYLERVRSVQDPQNLYQLAISILKLQFPRSSPEEIDILAFYLVGLVAAAEGGIQGMPNFMNETNEVNSLMLQLTMSPHSRVLMTLSNILMHISNTQDTLIQNLK